MEAGQILAFIIVAAIAGTAAASILKRGKSTRHWIKNIIIGGLGALVGQFLFDLLEIGLPDFLSEPITLADIIIAFLGALVVIFIIGRIKRF